MKRSTSSLNGFIERFRKAKILVVGDLMLDEFIWGKVSRISPEAPVPVVWIQSESLMPGGAANVASNLRALGGEVVVTGAVGEDRWGELLMGELAARQIDARGLVRTQYPTTVKTRVIAHNQQVVRVDRERQELIPGKVVKQLIDSVAAQIDSVDAVVIEDYGKGLITRELLEEILPLARERGKLTTVDPKEEHFDLYHRVTALTPNRAEAGCAIGKELKTDTELRLAGTKLVKQLECEGVLVTLGEEGMWLFERNGRQTRIPTVAQEVFDVAGAGDTVVAAFTLALASGANMTQAATLANYAAGIVVGKVGVGVATPRELRTALSTRRGRLSSAGLSSRRKRFKRSRVAVRR